MTNAVLFLSPNRNFTYSGIVKEQVNFAPNGEIIDKTSAYVVRFAEFNPPVWAAEQALANPAFQQSWSGLPPEANKIGHIGAWDSDQAEQMNGWGKCHLRKCGKDHSLKQHVEEALLSSALHGTKFIVAEQVKPTAPYPNYLQHTTRQGRRTIELVLDKVRALVEEDGYTADEIRAFEEATGRAESADIIAYLDTVQTGALVTA